MWSHWNDDSASLAAIESFESRDGRKEAELDIGNGSPKWKIMGLERADLEYRVVLLERFGVALDRIADCEPTPAMFAYVERYNATVRRYVEVKHGAGAVENALKDAVEASYVRRRKRG